MSSAQRRRFSTVAFSISLLSPENRDTKRADERTRTADLTHYECTVDGCRALHRLASPTQVSGFLFPALPTIAGHRIRVGVKVRRLRVSI